jgi:epoxyqueuosine reductase
LGSRHRLDHDDTGERPQAWVDVLDMLDATDEQLIERHGRWYLANRDPVWWRRNALVVLGNVGDASDPRVRRTLDRYLRDDDPILREHAEWAAAQLAAHA